MVSIQCSFGSFGRITSFLTHCRFIVCLLGLILHRLLYTIWCLSARKKPGTSCGESAAASLGSARGDFYCQVAVLVPGGVDKKNNGQCQSSRLVIDSSISDCKEDSCLAETAPRQMKVFVALPGALFPRQLGAIGGSGGACRGVWLEN